jgi:hypothetical protein
MMRRRRSAGEGDSELYQVFRVNRFIKKENFFFLILFFLKGF